MAKLARYIRNAGALVAFGALASSAIAGKRVSTPADLIITGTRVWTVDKAHPEAEAIAIKGDRIVAVGSTRAILALAGPKTRRIELHGGLVLPGFVDTHTHFGNAVDAYFTVRTIDVADQARLDERLAEAVKRVPKGMWITSADMGAFAGSAAAKRKDRDFKPFVPDLAAIDRLTPDHPIYLKRYDGAAFINSRAIALARITPQMPDPANGRYVKDEKTGALTGLLLGSAAAKTANILPPPTLARNELAGRAIVRELNALGITGIHDISRIDALSQQIVFPVDVERSFTDLRILQQLRTDKFLTLHVDPILSIAEWDRYRTVGIRPGSGDDRFHYGVLKLLLDSAYMSAPFANDPTWSGGLSYRITNIAKTKADMVGADRLGFDVATHVVGDLGVQFVLDAFAGARAANGPRDRRWRMIHMWYPSFAQVAEAGRDHMIIDVQPYQLIEQLKSIDGDLGPERAKSAFPWRTAIDDGMIVDLGSDWPGSYDGVNIAPNDPLLLIYYAVTRRPYPDAGAAPWHPEQAMTVPEAIAAYTLNPAFATREEGVSGSISVGKRADIVILSDDILKIPVSNIPKTKVRFTIVDGAVVWRALSD